MTDYINNIDFSGIFSDETMLALIESDINAHDPNRKFYDSFDDILAEIEEEGLDDE